MYGNLPAGLLSSHSLPNNGFGKDRNPLAPLSKTRSTGSPTLLQKKRINTKKKGKKILRKKEKEEEIQSSSKILENLLSCVACDFVGWGGWEKSDNAGFVGWGGGVGEK